MLLNILFRQTAGLERPVVALPILPTLRRLLLLRGILCMATPTRPFDVQPAICAHFLPFGQLSRVSSLLQSQERRVAYHLGALHDSVGNGHNGHRPSMGVQRPGGMGARALPLCACCLPCGRRRSCSRA